MSTKHTPGPWEFVREDGDRKIVAPTLFPTLRTRETLMSDTTYYPWCPTSDDDWRLIASAPELLEALSKLCALEADGRQAAESAIETWEQARALIAKTTGSAS